MQARGSRFAGVENRVLQRLAHGEAPARVQSTIRERSLQHAGRIIGGAESVPPLDRTAYGPDLPLRVSRRSRSLAILHSRHDAAERNEPIGSVLRVAGRGAEGISGLRRDAARAQRLRAEVLVKAGQLENRTAAPSEPRNREPCAGGAFFRPSGRGAAAPKWLRRCYPLTSAPY